MALQGAFLAHQQAFERLDCATVAVRQPKHLDQCDALVFPGGESTTMSKLAVTFGLWDPISELLEGGMAAFGTCAGAILLGASVSDGRPDQRHFGAIEMSVRRNGYGRQVDSFETEVHVDGLDGPFHASFIRAPIIESVGPGVEVLASVDAHPVFVRSGSVWATTFHPELSTGSDGHDDRIHRRFLDAALAGHQ